MTDYHLLLLGYALIGAISGWSGGMLGIGGGVIIVPALILLYDLANPHPAQLVTVIAIATSLSCIVFTSASAAITQARAGMVNWQIFQRLVIFFILGSYAAGWLIPHLPTAVVRGMIAGFLLFVGLVMVYAWKPKPSRTLPGIVGTAPLSFAGGMIAGTAGIAGGNVIVPGLTWFSRIW